MPAEGVTALLTSLLTSIHALHALGFLHADINPKNILMKSRDGRLGAALIDLGLSDRIDSTQLDSVRGTLSHAAPECIGAIQHPADERSDLYAIAASVFHAATGSLPRRGHGLAELIREHVRGPVPSLATARPDLPEAFSRLVDRMLSVTPEDRPRNAVACLLALGLSEPAHTATPPALSTELSQWLSTFGPEHEATHWFEAYCEAGAFSLGEEGWILADPNALPDRLPSALAASLDRRLASLPDESKQALGRSALNSVAPAGPGGGDEIVIDSPPPPLAVASCVVRPVGGRFVLVHPYLRDGLIQSLSSAECSEVRATLVSKEAASAAPDPIRMAQLLLALPIEHPLLTAHDWMTWAISGARRSSETGNERGARALLELARQRAASLGRASPLELEEMLGAALVALGDLEGASAVLDQALSRSEHETVPLELKARLRFRMAEAAMTRQESDLAWLQFRLGYRDLGAIFPTNTFSAVLLLLQGFALRVGSSFGIVKTRAADRARLELQLSEKAIFWGFLEGRALTVFALLIRGGLLLGLRDLRLRPPLADIAFQNILRAYVCAVLGLHATSNRLASRGLAISEKLENHRTKLLARFYYNALLHGLGEVVESERRWRNDLVTATTHLRAHEVRDGSADLCLNLLRRGRSTDLIVLYEEIDGLISKMNGDSSGVETGAGDNASALFYATALSWVGRTGESADIMERARVRLEGNAKLVFLRGHFIAKRMLQHYLSGDVAGDGLRAGADYRAAFGLDSRHRGPSKPLHLWDYLVAESYLLLEQARETPSSAHIELLDVALQQLEKIGRVPEFLCHARVLRGALEVLSGKIENGRKLLAEADTVASLVDNRWARCEAALWSARASRAAGVTPSVELEAARAYSLATDTNWKSRAAALRSEFQEFIGIDDSGSALAYTARNSAAVGATRGHVTEDRLSALIRVADAGSRAIDPKIQARAILSEVVELLHADRAILLMPADLSKATSPPAWLLGVDKDLQDLPVDSPYSKTMVRQVTDTLQGSLTTGTDLGALGSATSVVAQGLKSILAVPVVAHQSLLGVLYVDSRVARGLFRPEDLETCQALAAQIGNAFEISRLARESVFKAALEKDLEVTAAVQRLLLPKSHADHFSGIDMVTAYEPATQAGGDWWHVWSGSNTFRAVVCDVTGHGPGPAMITAIAYGIARMLGPDEGVMAFAEKMHRVLQEMCISSQGPESRYWMTMTGLEWRDGAETAHLFSASGPSSILSGAMVTLPSMPLGSPELQIGTSEVKFVRGSRLLLYSDRLTDLRLPGGRRVGPKGLSRLVGEASELPISTLHTNLLAVRDKYRDPVHGLEDDVTWIGLERL